MAAEEGVVATVVVATVAEALAVATVAEVMVAVERVAVAMAVLARWLQRPHVRQPPRLHQLQARDGGVHHSTVSHEWLRQDREGRHQGGGQHGSGSEGTCVRLGYTRGCRVRVPDTEGSGVYRSQCQDLCQCHDHGHGHVQCRGHGHAHVHCWVVPG